MARASSTQSLRLTVYCGERGTSTTDKMVDADTVKKICDIYDWDGKGELDLFFLGDIMYAMGYNTTKKVCVGLGQTDEEGKKFAKFDDVVSKVEEALKTPRQPGNLRRLRGAAEAVRQEPERHHDVGRAGQHPVQPRCRDPQGGRAEDVRRDLRPRGRGRTLPLHVLP